jgi:hypothetical protein
LRTGSAAFPEDKDPEKLHELILDMAATIDKISQNKLLKRVG